MRIVKKKPIIFCLIMSAIIYMFIGQPSLLIHTPQTDRELFTALLKHPEKLQKQVKIALKNYPNALFLHRLMAEVSYRLMDYKESSKHFAYLLKKDYQDGYFKAYFSSVIRLNKELAPSEWDALYSYYANHPHDWEIQLILADAHHRAHENKKAIELLNLAKKNVSNASDEFHWITQQIEKLNNNETI